MLDSRRMPVPTEYAPTMLYGSGGLARTPLEAGRQLRQAVDAVEYALAAPSPHVRKAAYEAAMDQLKAAILHAQRIMAGEHID